MTKTIIIILAATIALFLSKKLRAFVFHVRIRQFVIIFLFISFLTLLIGMGYFAWKYWWPQYLQRPTVEWTDTTIEHDENPITPGAGGPSKPTKIQIR